jgi:hypothetical protein
MPFTFIFNLATLYCLQFLARDTMDRPEKSRQFPYTLRSAADVVIGVSLTKTRNLSKRLIRPVGAANASPETVQNRDPS